MSLIETSTLSFLLAEGIWSIDIVVGSGHKKYR